MKTPDQIKWLAWFVCVTQLGMVFLMQSTGISAAIQWAFIAYPWVVIGISEALIERAHTKRNKER